MKNTKLKGFLRDLWPMSSVEAQNGRLELDLMNSSNSAELTWGRRTLIKIALAWSRAELELRRIRTNNPRTKMLEVAFWRRTESIKAIWHYLFIAEFQGDPINIAKMSREIDVDRAHITKVLKEARELGLCTEDNYLSEACLRYKINASAATAAMPEMRFYRHMCYMFFINLYAIRDMKILKAERTSKELEDTNAYLQDCVDGRLWDLFDPDAGVLDPASLNYINNARNTMISDGSDQKD